MCTRPPLRDGIRKVDSSESATDAHALLPVHSSDAMDFEGLTVDVPR
jgi:hypothetical protein